MFKDAKQRKCYFTFVVCFALIVLGINLVFTNGDNQAGESIIPTEPHIDNTQNNQLDKPYMKKETIKICLSGAVRNSGLYSVSKGIRVQEVLEKFAGVLPEADLSKVNLAKICRDGMQINIPFKKNYQTSKNSNIDKIEVSETNKETVSQKININTASSEELASLRGIGTATADEIIRYRIKHGPFLNKQELLKVKGIGTAKLARIEKLITW